jgi:PTS system nitrogen regulatory IIA component
MIFDQYLSQATIQLDVFAAGKRDLFQKLAAIVAPSANVMPSAILEALMNREQLGPTSCGHGIAMPHAIVPGLERPVIGFVRLAKSLFYCNWDCDPVDLVCLLLVPPTLPHITGIQMLSEIEHRLRMPHVIQYLRDTHNLQNVLYLLTADDPSLLPLAA